MARARNIKPGLCKNEDLAECSVWARYVFACLPMLADREGRLEDRPKRIKGELLPYDAIDVEPLLQELATHGYPPFIIRYQNESGRFIQITKFSEHQSPHYSEKQSVIKPPELPECPGHQECLELGELPESSGNAHPIKGGAQPPDSLIPDSLIPDSLIPDCPKTTTSRKRKKAMPLVLPDWIPKQQWNAWIEARTKARKPPTEFALKIAIGKLESLSESGHHPAAVLAQSAFNGWAGLFPVRNSGV